jgi:hypothetical protein
VCPVAITAIALALPSGAGAAAECPISYGAADDAKPNKVYTYYPTVADATFPEFGAVGGGPTSPAVPFDISTHGFAVHPHLNSACLGMRLDVVRCASGGH